MRKMVGLFYLLAICLSASSAQQKPTATDKWDVFAGYSFSRIYVANEAPFPMNLTGGQGAVTYNFTRHLGATAEIAGYTNDTDGITFSTQAFLFGPTARFGFSHGKNPRVSFFAHQLFGTTRMTITSDAGIGCQGTGTSPTCLAHPFTMASGGGFDVKVRKHIWVRPMQVEYFNEEISVDALGGMAAPAAGGPRSLYQAYGSGSSGIRITGQGLRYSGGVDYHF
jgi:hypothetical protein